MILNCSLGPSIITIYLICTYVCRILHYHNVTTFMQYSIEQLIYIDGHCNYTCDSNGCTCQLSSVVTYIATEGLLQLSD